MHVHTDSCCVLNRCHHSGARHLQSQGSSSSCAWIQDTRVGSLRGAVGKVAFVHRAVWLITHVLSPTSALAHTHKHTHIHIRVHMHIHICIHSEIREIVWSKQIQCLYSHTHTCAWTFKVLETQINWPTPTVRGHYFFVCQYLFEQKLRW